MALRRRGGDAEADTVPPSDLSDETDIGTFGGGDGDTGTAYLRRFELMARVRGWGDDAKLLQLVRRLRGKASAWYGRLPDAQATAWPALRGEFVKAFDRKVLGATPATRIRELRQRASTVEEYYSAFIDVARDAGLDIGGELARDLFVSGLKHELQPFARARVGEPVADIARYAAAIEAELGIAARMRRPSSPVPATPGAPGGFERAGAPRADAGTRRRRRAASRVESWATSRPAAPSATRARRLRPAACGRRSRVATRHAPRRAEVRGPCSLFSSRALREPGGASDAAEDQAARAQGEQQ
jgi:hypothetical protein